MGKHDWHIRYHDPLLGYVSQYERWMPDEEASEVVAGRVLPWDSDRIALTVNWADRIIACQMPDPMPESPWQTGTPPGPGWYLVTYLKSEFIENGTGKEESPTTGFARYTSGGGWGTKDVDMLCRPIWAWQPLPEPYRGEG